MHLTYPSLLHWPVRNQTHIRLIVNFDFGQEAPE